MGIALVLMIPPPSVSRTPLRVLFPLLLVYITPPQVTALLLQVIKVVLVEIVALLLDMLIVLVA